MNTRGMYVHQCSMIIFIQMFTKFDKHQWNIIMFVFARFDEHQWGTIMFVFTIYNKTTGVWSGLQNMMNTEGL